MASIPLLTGPAGVDASSGWAASAREGKGGSRYTHASLVKELSPFLTSKYNCTSLLWPEGKTVLSREWVQSYQNILDSVQVAPGTSPPLLYDP